MGDFYFSQRRSAAFSPDLSSVIFTRPDPGLPSYANLTFANPDGTRETAVDYAMIDLQSWSPDGTIAYFAEDAGGSSLKIGRVGSAALVIDSGGRYISARWVEVDELIFVRGTTPSPELLMFAPHDGVTVLTAPASAWGVTYDYAPKP